MSYIPVLDLADYLSGDEEKDSVLFKDSEKHILKLDLLLLTIMVFLKI